MPPLQSAAATPAASEEVVGRSTRPKPTSEDAVVGSKRACSTPLPRDKDDSAASGSDAESVNESPTKSRRHDDRDPFPVDQVGLLSLAPRAQLEGSPAVKQEPPDDETTFLHDRSLANATDIKPELSKIRIKTESPMDTIESGSADNMASGSYIKQEQSPPDSVDQEAPVTDPNFNPEIKREIKSESLEPVDLHPERDVSEPHPGDEGNEPGSEDEEEEEEERELVEPGSDYTFDSGKRHIPFQPRHDELAEGLEYYHREVLRIYEDTHPDASSYIFPVGRFRGMRVTKVPAWYVVEKQAWLENQPRAFQDLREALTWRGLKANTNRWMLDARWNGHHWIPERLGPFLYSTTRAVQKIPSLEEYPCTCLTCGWRFQNSTPNRAGSYIDERRW
ncbi:hypothetical protein P171DRAFT_515855 [Karstenula rhodostoma CBS 690.94]|uniref:Uncharacterized protein n=1 Tax=Karstenula rhodostoma CBS 690.94 TaxID=1392251 RepID=A0A9P4UIP2_9PLEO|nr:hypothetical protein P171DRAFT_515855 [Karstenula rhodostoma CBS 690.94]